MLSKVYNCRTEDKQKQFIDVLARTRNVSRAAAVGMSRESAYRLRKRPDGAALARAWDWVLSLPPKPRGHIEVHTRRAPGPLSDQPFPRQDHKGHGSHKSALQHQHRGSRRLTARDLASA